jgi:hypothetical protein
VLTALLFHTEKPDGPASLVAIGNRGASYDVSLTPLSLRG